MVEFFLNSTISEGVYLNKNILWIAMPNNVQYREFLKTNIPNARWSSTQKLWFVPDTKANRSFLKVPAKLYNASLLLNKIHPVNQPNLQRFIETLRLKAYSENTIKTYAVEFSQWLYVLESTNVQNTSDDDLRSYLLWCITELKLSENQIHSRLNALKFFYEKVLNRENFFFDIPRPKKKSNLPKVFSTHEIKLLFKVTTNLKHLMILKLGYGLGLRVSEIATIKISNIDSKRMLVHIENSKGKKDRYVPLPHSILNELRAYYVEFKPHQFLFENKNKQPLSIRSIQAIFNNAKTKANITKAVGIHGLRHSYATHLLEYGTDMSIIQKLLGHKNVKTTEVYAKVSNTFISKVKSPLDELDF